MLKNNYSLICYGGVGSVTGANFLFKSTHLDGSSTKILVDCGLIQGSKFSMEENRKPFEYNPSEVDYLIVTHAHMDHIGRIPKLVRDGFNGIIYSTEETKEIASVMFEDALGLLAREEREFGLETMYEKEDISKALSLWKTINYHSVFSLNNDLEIYLKDAGHILGSAIVELTFGKEKGKFPDNKERKIVFTGDLGNSPTPLLPDTEVVDSTDYMVIESVYGDRNHGSKTERDLRLKKVIHDTLIRGGTVVIPAFSIERTQVILYAINNFIESKEIPQVPVFLDSPLAIKITEIYKRNTENFNDKAKAEIKSGDDIFNFPGLKIIRDHHESEQISRVSGPKIIIAGSGMSMGGRVLSHEKEYLGDPKSSIVLVGYQVSGSIGRQIEENVKKIKIDNEHIKVRAHIEKISGFSSHKDSNNLVDFVSHSAYSGRLKKVFVAMGENKSSTFLAQRLNSELGVNSVVPEGGREYFLD